MGRYKWEDTYECEDINGELEHQIIGINSSQTDEALFRL